MTRTHSDRINIGDKDFGYSIRVGTSVPANAVNLAYVHTPEVSPKRNLQITDTTDKIIENKLRSTVASEKMVFPGDDFLLREITRPFYSPSKNVVLTDEFSVPTSGQETPLPLYYKAEARGLFDGLGATVCYYPGGYVDRMPSNIVNYSQIDQSRINTGESLLYLGNKIRITRADGTAIPSGYKYKIQLVKQSGEGVPPHSYRVIVYTNFRGDGKESFLLRYERFNTDETHTSDFVEVLNAYPFFTEVSKPTLDALALDPKLDGQWRPDLNLKQYAIDENDSRKWEVYAPAQVLIADNVTRPAQQFRYKIKGKFQTKMNLANPGTIKVGLMYINENVFGAEDFTLVLKKIYGDGYKPPYLDFENPHPPANLAKTDDKYWTIDLTMPADYLNDYDLIILSGFGNIDMDIYNDSIRNYLQNGGRVWIDNAGSGTEVLHLNGFLTNITFSTTQDIGGVKVYGISDNDLGNYDEYSLERRAAERLYNIKKTNMEIGYPNINPLIEFGFGEDSALWSKIVAYQTNEASVMTRKMFDNGALIVSNCGIFRSLANRTSEDIKLVMNMILSIAEEKNITTPWIRDYVYHRDNLFAEEYKIGDMDLYIDDRSDIDTTQMVAKKMINRSVRDALIPYMPSSYYKAKGTFKVEVEADKQVVVINNDFEVGTLGSTNIPFNITTEDAIEGWSTNALSGGVPIFTHITSLSERGARAITVQTNSMSAAYWHTTEIPEALFGTYRASVWVKTSNVTGVGAKMSIHKEDGSLIAESPVILGTRDWTKVEVTFGTSVATNIEIRLGFPDQSTGQAWFDFVELVSVGSVYMTPENAGDVPLYAYSVRPSGDIFDLRTQGFTNADVTVYDPPVQFYSIIRSFVYKWDNTLVRYLREYGNYSRALVEVRRSDGTINIGALTALVPDLKDGAGWADRSKVFFELSIEPVDGNDTSDFVNVAFFNTKTGRYYFSEFGEDIIGFTELYDATAMKHIVVQAWTDYYTIRATKRRYAIKPLDDERIYLEYPATIDDREAWHLRVHNGSFVKSEPNFHDDSAIKELLAQRRFGTHQYSLPEYDRQLFKPGQPYRRVRKEIVEYVNDTTVRVQHTPLYVQSGKVLAEQMVMIGSDQKIFKASKGDWLKLPAPNIYMDNNGDGAYIDYPGEYDIDYTNGIVFFPEAATGNVKVDYTYNNIEVFKRTYASGKIKREELQTVDKKTFYSGNGRKNWLLHPAPIVYRLPYGKENEKDYIAPVSTYRINYETGEIVFIEDVNDRILIDYTYSVDRQLSIRDYDVHSGLLYLNNAITFKDEIYANYYYEENFVDYRGYYDEEIEHFMHLDLNPSEGHYVTIPTVRVDPTDSRRVLRYENVPTAKLLNKEIYVYLIPHSDSFGNVNNYTIRHCFSKAEWDKIVRAKLGTAVLLGIIQIREHARVTDATVLDTRTRGGGLKQSISRDVMIKKDPLTASYWDMGQWEGQAYYSNGVLVIQLPRTILVSEGGQFTEKQVQEVLKKYVAYGVHVIAEYVDPALLTLDQQTIFIQGATFPNTLNK